MPEPDLSHLFHQLNNQLGVILANAELLEQRIADEKHKLRAGQVVAGALDAISTAKQIKQLALAGKESVAGTSE